jgi:tetratricopeptide (TPR) repeat protein
MNHFHFKTICFVSVFLIRICFPIFLAAQVKMAEEKWILPTYPVEAPEKNPMFFKGESYQGASKIIYPYALNDMISNDRIEKAWKTLILENEYIKLCVTPEIGGKLWYATDKTNGYNFVYKNNVVKPSNIGMTGAWVSGGIEWCVLHHHRASTMLPVDYDLKENPDGSKTIWIGETEPRHSMRWSIGITAFPGKSYFQAEVKIHNPTPFTNTFLYWANVAAHTNKDYQVIFPPSVNTVTYHAKNSFSRWPVSTEVYNGEDFTRGVDISWWKNSVNQNSYFAYDLKEDFMGGYDHGKQTGTVHIGDHNIVKGAKLWEWGSGERGQATEGRLTEKDGPYVEIMVGAFSDNQPDYSWIRPYETKTFKQYWFPVKDIGGFKNANLNGAVNLEKISDQQLFLGYYSTQNVPKVKIVLRNKEKVIFEKQTPISPDKPFTIKLPYPENEALTNFYTEMVNLENGETLLSYQPVERKRVDKLPETVKRPVPPGEMKSVEELYLTGSRILQFYNPTLNAMDYFNEALKRDPRDTRTNTVLGNIALKNGDYARARHYFNVAINRLTKDYTRPSNCEALYLQGITLKALGLLDEATDTLYRATWDLAFYPAAYLELAKISCQKVDFEKALQQINESLKTNAVNNSAIVLKAAVLRKLGDFTASTTLLEPLLENDPLDFRVANELYLTLKNAGNKQKSEEILADLTRNIRNSEQNYLNLAIGYINDGFTKEAEELLLRFPGRYPEISYLLGFLADSKGDKREAERYFNEASGLPVDYVFPYHIEMAAAFETASKYFPNDAKPLYYLGNLYYDKQPEKAVGYWEKAVALDPTMAIACRNLGWGHYYHSGDVSKAIAAYEKAFYLKKDEPIYYAELDPLYEKNNTPVEQRAKLFEGVNDIVKKRDDAFVRQIMVLNLSGQWEKAVEYLAGSNFHFREGSSRVRDITVDAHLLLAKKYFAEKKYKEALEQFQASSGDVSSIGSRNEDERAPQINYFLGLAWEALGNKTKAKACFLQSAEQTLNNPNYIRYYQGLSFLKLGNKAKATEIFNALIREGENRLDKGTEVDFFAKFGEKEAGNVQLSNAYLLKGLGCKGLGENANAREFLQKAVEFSVSNLWATTELKGLE